MFGQLFLLLMVYPGYWFPMLYGTPGVLGDVGRTVFVHRERNTGFYLTKVGDNGWNVTPESSNNTYEYKYMFIAYVCVIYVFPTHIISPCFRLKNLVIWRIFCLI